MKKKGYSLDLLDISCILLAVAFCFLIQRVWYLQTAEETTGVVTRIDKNKRNVPYASIEFKTATGRTTSFRTSNFVESAPLPFVLGDSVKVYYQPGGLDNPIVNSFERLWYPTLLIAGCGCIGLLLYFSIEFFSKR